MLAICHLFFQLISYINYFFWTHEQSRIKSVPSGIDAKHISLGASLVTYIVPGFTDKGTSYFLFFIFLNIFFFKAILQPDQYLGIDERKMLPVRLSKEKCIEHFRKIDEMINTMQFFLDPELSLHNVAQAVKLSDRVVSQAIKLNAEQNFTDYINTKRIEYAKEMLRKTTKAEKNVLEILYEAGFNSKSVFNTQFKKHTGISPTEFRETAHRDSALSPDHAG